MKTLIDINIGILNEVLSIFGGSPGGWNSAKRRWRGEEDKDEEREDDRGPMDRYLWKSRTTTSMRMSYAGEGYPLRLLL
jgi:hypothetical protein